MIDTAIPVRTAKRASLAIWLISALAALVLAVAGFGSVAAQDLETFDPDEAYAETAQDPVPAPQGQAGSDTGAIDADLMEPAADPTPISRPVRVPASLSQAQNEPASPADGVEPQTATDRARGDEFEIYSEPPAGADSIQWVDPASGASVSEGDAATQGTDAVATNDTTYAEDDLIGAAEGVFGKGAEGLARMIEDLLKKEGQPNGYIVGREAGGAFIVGARYGSGTLHHKVEGERKVYWTGPSVGFDAGANAANTFVLVYNLYDSEDLFKRFPAGEGQAYLVGGLHASYMRWGDVVLIPIRMGAGVRLGVNAGYMKFSKKQRWLPF